MKVKAHTRLKAGIMSLILAGLTFSSVSIQETQASNHGSHLQSSHLQTYVIHTYGGASLLPAVRQTLAGYGGSASVYQDKLVIRTTPSGHQAVTALLSQIDHAPQVLKVTVRVGNQSTQTGNIRQGQVILSNRGIFGTGQIADTQSSQTAQQSYQVQTLSGKPASIGTSTLLSLATPTSLTRHNRYGQPDFRITILGTTLVNAEQGIAVTPTLLPNGQLQLQLAQAQNQMQNMSKQNLSSQNLATTVQVARGQWLEIGQIASDVVREQSGYRGYQHASQSQTLPIQIRVD